MTSMLVDYLVSETMARSDGAIDFPSQFIEGYGYMQSKFYGTQKGRFYDAKDAILWMPKQLLKIDNVEINYIAARGENALYLALINESARDVTANITLIDKLVPKGSYRVHDLGKGPVTVTDKAFPWEFTVPLDASAPSMSFSISALQENGKTHTGKTHQLSKH